MAILLRNTTSGGGRLLTSTIASAVAPATNNWVVQTPGGAADLVAPTLGNLLSSKVRVVVEHVTWDSTGYLFSQAHSSSSLREFGLFIQSGSYRVIAGGTSNTVAPVSSFPLVDATIDLTIDYVAGTVILICDQTEMFNGPITIGAGRSDGENFRVFGRRGGWRAPNGTRVGNTKVYIDDILVRDYDFNNSNHGAQQVDVDELITPSNNLLATNMALDGTPWIDIGGGPIADPIRTALINSTLAGFNQNLLGSISSNSINAIVTSTLSSFNQGLLGNVTTSIDSNITSLLNGFNQGLTGGLSSTAVSGVISSTLSGFSQGLNATSLVVSISGSISSQLSGFNQGISGGVTTVSIQAQVASLLNGFSQGLSVINTPALLQGIFPVSGLDVSGLSYAVFDGYDVTTADRIKSGTDASIVSGLVSIDLSAETILGDEVLLILSDFTESPTVISKVAVSFSAVTI